MIRKKFYDILIIICIIVILTIYWQYIKIKSSKVANLNLSLKTDGFKQGFEKNIEFNGNRTNDNNFNRTLVDENVYCKKTFNESVLKENSSKLINIFLLIWKYFIKIFLIVF